MGRGSGPAIVPGEVGTVVFYKCMIRALAVLAIVLGSSACGGDIDEPARVDLEAAGVQPGVAAPAAVPVPGSGDSDDGSEPPAGGEVTSPNEGSPGGDPTAPGDGDGDDAGDPAPSPPAAGPDDPLEARIFVAEVALTEGVDDGGRNYGIWGRDSLPVARVFTAPLTDCGSLVCTTTAGGGQITPRVLRLDAEDKLVETFALEPGLHCRGLAAEPDGHFAVLLWDDDADRIHLRRFDLAGEQSWSTELTNDSNTPDAFDIGESRVEYGDGRYGAYYHVHSDDGHEGDTLKWVDAVAGTESTGWAWGCSHSMSNLLRHNPAVGDFMSACVTDCYPGTSGDFSTNSVGGIYINGGETHVIDVDAGCDGNVAGELGGAALAPDGWRLVFNGNGAARLDQRDQDPSSLGNSTRRPTHCDPVGSARAVIPGRGAGRRVGRQPPAASCWQQQSHDPCGRLHHTCGATTGRQPARQWLGGR